MGKNYSYLLLLATSFNVFLLCLGLLEIFISIVVCDFLLSKPGDNLI